MIPATNLCNLEDDCLNGCLCTHQLNFAFNRTVRLVLRSAGLSPNQRTFTHPIHLHGHSFHVVGTGYGTYNSTTGAVITPTQEIVCQNKSNKATCVFPSWTNDTSPRISLDQFTIRKDTIILPALGYVIIHFITNNPGWWFLHCHMEPHQLEGMALVINEAPERQPPPPPGMQTCGNFSWTVKEFQEAVRFDPNDNGSGLPTWAIVLIVIACVFVVLAVIVVIVTIVHVFCIKIQCHTLPFIPQISVTDDTPSLAPSPSLPDEDSVVVPCSLGRRTEPVWQEYLPTYRLGVECLGLARAVEPRELSAVVVSTPAVVSTTLDIQCRMTVYLWACMFS